MSFGGSAGDIITAATLALRAYRACKAAAGEFAELTREVSAVSILVQELEEQAASPSFARNQKDCRRQVEIRSLIDGIIYPLRELEELATKYSGLSSAKKNNWDRLRFATKRIDDIRARLILHTCAAQTFLDGLVNRSVTRIERKSDETSAALTRVEQVLADIVKEIKHGSKDPSVVSDEKWNIWTELKRELRIEGYPVEVVQQHKDQIKQYLINLLQDAGLQDEVLLDELDPPEINGTNDEAQSSSSTQIQKTIAAIIRRVLEQLQPPEWAQVNGAIIALSNPRTRSLALLLFLSTTIAFVGLLQSIKQYDLLFHNESFARYSANLTSAREIILTSAEHENKVTLELKAGLFKNEHPIRFTCAGLFQAQVWIDQLSPLFDPKLVDESAIKVIPFLPSANEEARKALQVTKSTSQLQHMDASYSPLNLQQLDGYYWDIFSKEMPCNHQHERTCDNV